MFIKTEILAKMDIDKDNIATCNLQGERETHDRIKLVAVIYFVVFIF